MRRPDKYEKYLVLLLVLYTAVVVACIAARAHVYDACEHGDKSACRVMYAK